MGEGSRVLAGLAGVGLVLACHLPLTWAGRSQARYDHMIKIRLTGYKWDYCVVASEDLL